MKKLTITSAWGQGWPAATGRATIRSTRLPCPRGRGALAAEIAVTATNTGASILIVVNGGLNQTGTYCLTGTGFATDGLLLCLPLISGATLDVTGIGGLSSINSMLYRPTNVETPLSVRAPVLTNPFDPFAVFT